MRTQFEPEAVANRLRRVAAATNPMVHQFRRKLKTRTTRSAVLLFVMSFMTGCVGLEMGSDAGGPRTAAWKGLNSEQREQLRAAASAGDNELVSTVGRMAWDDPSNAIALGNYAASLNPDCTEQITAAVTRARQ